MGGFGKGFGGVERGGCGWVVGVPKDVVIAHVGETFFAGWDIDSFTFSVDDFGLILFGVDLEEEVMDRRAFGGF